MIPIELLAAGGLLMAIGMIAAWRVTNPESSASPKPSNESGTSTTNRWANPPTDDSAVDDPSVDASEPGPPDNKAEPEESEQSDTKAESEVAEEPAEQKLSGESDDEESRPDQAAPDRRVLGLIGAAANASTRGESALDDGDYDIAENHLQSAQSTLDTAIEVDDTHDLGRATDLEARRACVEKLLEDVDRQREGVSNADKRVIGMLGSAASSVSYAETAIDDGDYELAETRLQSALSTYQTATKVNETHSLERGDDIQRRMAEVEDLLADVERQRDSTPATSEEGLDDVDTNDDRELTDVSGVLSSDADALRAAGFESAAALERASTEDLQAIEGIDPHVALRIKADVGG